MYEQILNSIEVAEEDNTEDTQESETIMLLKCEIVQLKDLNYKLQHQVIDKWAGKKLKIITRTWKTKWTADVDFWNYKKSLPLVGHATGTFFRGNQHIFTANLVISLWSFI